MKNLQEKPLNSKNLESVSITEKYKMVVTKNTIKNNYKEASVKVYNKLPRWKQRVIDNCRVNNTNDRIMDEFAASVCEEAEK